ncbi:hypothetical protein MSZK_54330 [Mycobacterium sp. shizuoka-1]|nr:hypothetical protein MSZK_54330 [Mycobacterium sp. shizuoka-1]
MTGAALVSAAAVVTASPAFLPTHDIAVGAPSSLPLSTAKYELTALSDITIQGINDAYWFGWGGYITDTNTYYPGVSDRYVSGASGVLYYLVDNAAETFLPGFDLDNYYFEIGAPAVPYVAAGELFGTSSPIFQAAQATFYYGIPNVINSIVVSATELVPEINIGPIKIGAGYLASLYFYGQTPDYDPTTGTGFSYGSNGLSAIWAYISTSISDNLPGAPSGAALSSAVAAATVAVENGIKGLEDAVKTVTSPATSSSAAAKSTTKAVSAAAEVKTETEAEDTTPATGGTTSTEGSSSTDDSSSTEGSSSTDDSTSTPATSTGSAAPSTPKSTATKPAKPQNPLNKIGKKISDALGITKKSKPSTKSSSDSSSSSSSSSSSGTGGSAK